MEHFGEYLIHISSKASPNGAPRCVGCSDEEIEKLMMDQGVSRLPRLYREYLEVMGKSGILSSIYPGSDWSYEHLLNIKQDWQEDLIMYRQTFIVPEKAFVFFQHGGYEYRYFITDTDYGGGDCPTYMWSSDNSEQGYHISVRSTIREYFEYHASFNRVTGKFKNTLERK